MVVLPRLKYHLRRMSQKSTRWWLMLPLSFVLIVLLSAGFFLSSLIDRESLADILTVRLVRETGIRSHSLEGIGLSTNKSLSPNLLDEGSFDQLTFRKELQARSLGGSNFSLHTLDHRPEIYRSPDLPVDQSLALFEGGTISLDRLEQGRLYPLGQGTVQSGEDDVILEEVGLSFSGKPRWSTLATRHSEDQQLLDTMVVLEDGRVVSNVHTEQAQVLSGRTPRNIGGLFYVNKRPHAWTSQGAIYEYQNDEKRWSLVVPGIAQNEELHDLIPLGESKYFAAGDEHFYFTDLLSWELRDAPEVRGGRWNIAQKGEALYALRNGALYANLPPWIHYETELVYEEPSVLQGSEHRWVKIHDGSSSARLLQDPLGELLFLDPAKNIWHSLRDLLEEADDLFAEESPYALTHEFLMQGDMPSDINKLTPLGRGRLLAETPHGAFLIPANDPRGTRLFSESNSHYLALNDMSLLEVGDTEAKRLQLTSTLKIEIPELVGFGELYRATLEQQLSPAAYEEYGGSYPWTVSKGSHYYQKQEPGSDVVLEEPLSYNLVLVPDEGKSEVHHSIALDKGVKGGELMTFSFKASSEVEGEPQRLRLVLSGPFRTYTLQSDRIKGELRSYSMTFRLPDFQVDREATSLDLSLQWEGDSELVLDDLVFMTRGDHDETGVAATLRYEIQELKPHRFRFSLDEGSGFSDHAHGGLHSKTFRTRLNQVMQTCDLLGVEPWIVIPPDWTAEEHAELFQYLAANITDPLGRLRLEDGWGQAWLRRLPLVYFEVSAGAEDSHDDLLHAAQINRVLTAMTQSSSYEAVKNQVFFLDGLDYTSGRMLSGADGHAKSLDLADYRRQAGEDMEFTKDRILDLYYADTPRLPDGVEPWVASLQDSESRTNLNELLATILELMQQGVTVNLDQAIFLPEDPGEAALASKDLSKKDADRLLLWTRFNELAQGQRLQTSLDAELDVQAAEGFTWLAMEYGSEIRLIVVADSKGDRKKIEFSMHQFEAERMRLHRFDREGRLYEDRDSKRPETTFTLAPGDILLVALNSEK